MKRIPERHGLNFVFSFFILEGDNTCMFATSSKVKNDYAHHDSFNFIDKIKIAKVLYL